ncbi:Ig-like domain-containing protein [Hahella ganghwensis]|uniref:Ig-like domain-containing protein n=1 Tax=Hahella ganghwensis TaxID=286420 RepID=UPI000378A64E|nr:VPLPA-CTERM sorting domain-containing protein [Hahella ganghwensis]
MGTPPGTFPHSGVGTISVSGPGLATSISDISIAQDTSDIRRTKVTESFNVQLPGAGLYTMTWSSSSWVFGVPNASGAYGTTSTIYWDGSSANAPILFDLENIQQQVIRGTNYSDNLDAVGSGLTYDDTTLSSGMFAQATGYSIDSSGQVTISAADTAGYADNASNPGADMAFSGEINATDGSSVEFVWLFDAVNEGSGNLAPEIQDVVINALVGDTIEETLVVTDPNGDPLTVDFINFVGEGGVMPGNALFDPSTWDFTWDSTGFAPGQYIATFRASDGNGLTDQGTITINLRDPSDPPVTVPVPATGLVLITGMGLFSLYRRKSRKS